MATPRHFQVIVFARQKSDKSQRMKLVFVSFAMTETEARENVQRFFDLSGLEIIKTEVNEGASDAYLVSINSEAIAA